MSCQEKARELAIADNRVSEIDLEWNPEVPASLDVDLSQFWDEGELMVFTVERIGSTEPNQPIEDYAQTKSENR